MTDAVRDHYGAPDLVGRIEDGLAAMGKSPATVTPDDLASVDEFHIRGAAATDELIELVDAGPDAHVLDVGAGLGGPARRLASAIGCRVTGIDLSADYCAAGTVINRWLGLDKHVELLAGDATDLARFATASFDAAWTIHAVMNIAARDALYGGIARVVKPGGRFVAYDVLTTGGQDIHLPVPWAREPAASHLLTRDAFAAALTRAGLEAFDWRERTGECIDFLERAAARFRAAPAVPPLGLHLILGRGVPVIIGNLRRNLREGRLAIVVVVCRRAA